ncbi:hypothetical protein [Sorangium sp. So ce426]|uniref:hypothetical protein n=1 Tax=unclassified Sorangium TaxID=2621164 RepID=UPI003F5AF9D2
MVSGTIIVPGASAFDLQRGADEDIAFGGGDHYCIGATLARLEARLAMDTLLGRPRDGARGTGRAGAAALDPGDDFIVRPPPPSMG